jgi:hypothetical protein
MSLHEDPRIAAGDIHAMSWTEYLALTEAAQSRNDAQFPWVALAGLTAVIAAAALLLILLGENLWNL